MCNCAHIVIGLAAVKGMAQNIPMIAQFAIVAATVLAAIWLWRPSLRRSPIWQAMTTPLASIIGSGFLVLGPILATDFGGFAPLVMGLLCLLAYLFGAAIRFNITVLGDSTLGRRVWVRRLEDVSSWALGFAYFVSVAYYLNLFGAFAFSLTDFGGGLAAKLTTSALFLLILGVGWVKGFKQLEAMEYVTVSLKLSIIAGLLVGLAIYFGSQAAEGQLSFALPRASGWSAIVLVFGLLVTVQGFETSRYLGDDYDRETRLASMKLAQWISSGIYLAYIALLTYALDVQPGALSETAIVAMMAVVAPILPLMLVGGALAAQFSAAVADTGGAGGLLAEVSRNRISVRWAYVMLTVVGLALTWGAEVFQIISYASRAFAVYYALQAGLAAALAFRGGQPARGAGFGTLAALGAGIAVFGAAVEGGS
jgi:hypothetical protein